MTGKWECAIKANTSDGETFPEDYHHDDELLYEREPATTAERPYESESPRERPQTPKSVKSIYRRRNKSFDKLLFQEMLAEAKQHGLRYRASPSRSCSSRNTRKSLKKKGRTARANSSSKSSRAPTPPRPIMPDLPEEWL